MTFHTLHLIAVGIAAWLFVAFVVGVVVGRLFRAGNPRPGYLDFRNAAAKNGGAGLGERSGAHTLSAKPRRTATWPSAQAGLKFASRTPLARSFNKVAPATRERPGARPNGR